MHEVKSIQDLLNQISRDEILLPEFQRGYVWNRDQVRGLMQSLYRKHPTGHLLIWRTYKPSLVRGGETARDGHSLLLLDGQQRLTTLYVLFKGKAPRFYEGESLFFDLHFNMQTQEFRFWQKSQMENNPAWIGVHEFLQEGLTALLERLEQLDEERRTVIQQNLARLGKLDKVRDYTYTVDRRDDRVNKKLEGVVVKTVAGFLNAAGGTLLIGVDDTGTVVGLAADYGTLTKHDRDGFELHLNNILARDFGPARTAAFLNVNFHELDGQDICQVTVEPRDSPIYVEQQGEETLYLRVGNGTQALPVKEAVTYVGRRWGNTA